nr:hypothetical protein CPGR_05433 [Mycolicibacterium fortuitum subsp. fortuitum DSM 46621 = ATCC 6841 = JCM 6387]
MVRQRPDSQAADHSDRGQRGRGGQRRQQHGEQRRLGDRVVEQLDGVADRGPDDLHHHQGDDHTQGLGIEQRGVQDRDQVVDDHLAGEHDIGHRVQWHREDIGQGGGVEIAQRVAGPTQPRPWHPDWWQQIRSVLQPGEEIGQRIRDTGVADLVEELLQLDVERILAAVGIRRLGDKAFEPLGEVGEPLRGLRRGFRGRVRTVQRLEHRGLYLEHRGRRLELWHRGHRGVRRRLVGGHHRGGLCPHPRIVGLVQRYRNGVDTKEIRAHQHRVCGVVGGQLSHGRHGRQGAGIGPGGGLQRGGRRRGLGFGAS